MDNFTHSLTGWAIGQAGLKTKSRKGLAGLILGANMPDIDVFFGWVPWVPLATHRGATHSLVWGTLLMPPLLAGLLWLLDRWQLRRGAVFKSGLAMHVPWLVALSYIGTLTHPLLDLQTSYSVQLLSPFSNRWFHTETLFIIDVWLWSLLAFAIWLSRRRERSGQPWRNPPRIALAVMCLYIALNSAISLTARRALLDHVPYRPDVIIAGEEPVLFWKRQLIWRHEGGIGRADYDPLRLEGAFHGLRPLVPDNMDLTVARRASRANPEARTFMRWSIMPIAEVQETGCDVTVAFGDARFGIPARTSRLTRTVTLPGEGPDCRGD